MGFGKRIIALLLGALVLTDALVGCGDQEDGEQLGFTMSACVCAAPESIDPAFCTGAETEPIFRALFENLVRLRETEEGERVVEPAVAKEWEVVENFDGTVDYVFSLRSAARWSDGTRVKARDFVYAWRRLVNPATGSPNATMLSMVSGFADARESGDATRLGVSAVNDSTLRVTLNAPCAWFLSDVCTAVATMPLRSDVAGKKPEWATGIDMPGNGAFRLSVWTKGESLYLRRNEYYFDAHASAADALHFRFAETPEAGRALYDEGLVDYVLGVRADTEGAEALPLRETVAVLYNHVSDLFSNEHVRRAFELTLDREAVAAAMGGGQTPATGLVPHGVVNAPDDPLDFRAEGGALLAVGDEGYDERCEEARAEIHIGAYWGDENFPEVSCLYPADSAECAAAAASCAGIWAERLHVTVRPEGLEREDFDSRLAQGDYDLAVDAFAAPCGDAMTLLVPYGGQDGANALHYVSKPYELLIGVAESSHDLAARAAMLHDAEALLLEDASLSPLTFGGRCCLLRDTVTGVRHDPNGCPIFNAASPAA